MKELNSYDIYLKEVKNAEYLTETEEAKLFVLAKGGDFAARNRIIESALHFVISLAKKFTLPKVFSFNDLVGYGNEGLMEAYNHYKPGNNARFLTYAYFWIYKYMNDAIHNYGRTVRLPQTWEEKLSRIFTTIENLGNEGAVMTESQKIRYVAGILHMKEGEAEKIINSACTELSLDAPLAYGSSSGSSFGSYGEEENDTLGTKISVNEPSPEDNCMNGMLSEYLWDILDSLPEVYKQVLIERNGLDNKGVRSFQKIGDELGVSKEQIRTYERRALTLAKKMASEKELDYYLAA